MKRRIRVVKQVVDIYPKYQPKVGEVYEAEYSAAYQRKKNKWENGKGEFCILDILDKKIILRKGEFELLEV